MSLAIIVYFCLFVSPEARRQLEAEESEEEHVNVELGRFTD